MGSSVSSISSGSSGSVYQQFYFDPDAGSIKRPEYCVTDEDLRQVLPQLVDVSEKINRVRYYTHPLNGWQFSKFLLHHAFVVLETESWWWSIEKDEGGVTIQRSKYLENVRDKCRRHDRITGITSGIDLVKKAPGNATVIELLNYMWSKDYFNLEYHFLENNCKHFANIIYEYVLKSPASIRRISQLS